eukprot:TRINITY_DN25448_c0_g1_i2.p1 TRINITY_DN25448_c0_g1~~TRINITY_DN25448_c0_g1_i2.p1  ORF type:complete len:272 (-),score=34.51 TRINITY_DN25448_c0_g1_i2:306-1121(-)
MCGTASAKELSMVISCGYWHMMNRNGEVSGIFKFSFYFFTFISYLLKFSMLFFLSKGWGITRTYIIPSEIRSIFVVVLILTINSFIYKILFVPGFLLYPTLFTFLVAMRYMLSSQQYNIHTLQLQAKLLHNLNTDVERTQKHKFVLDKKESFFWIFEVSCIFFVFILVLRLMLNEFFMHQPKWSGLLVEELLEELFVIFSCGLLLRMRNFHETGEGKDEGEELKSRDTSMVPSVCFLVIQNPGPASIGQSLPGIQLAAHHNTSIFLPVKEE